MKELADGMDVEGRGLFFVEGTQSGVVGCSSFAQANIALDNLDDVDLLLHALGKITHGGTCLQHTSAVMGSVWKRWKARIGCSAGRRRRIWRRRRGER